MQFSKNDPAPWDRKIRVTAKRCAASEGGTPSRRLGARISARLRNPSHARGRLRRGSLLSPLRGERRLVGVPGLEPGTSSLSGTRSNQLSYTPEEKGLIPPVRPAPRLRRAKVACPAVGSARESSPAFATPRTARGRLRRGSLLSPLRGERRLVEATGLEPVTFCLQSRCSTN